jgi:hypothetical protein
MAGTFSKMTAQDSSWGALFNFYRGLREGVKMARS